jgi:hypothetical protein
METPLEYVLTNLRKAEMLAFISEHPEYYGELVSLSLSGRQPYAWKAARLLQACMDDNDPHLQPCLPEMLKLVSVASNDTHQRILMMILQRMELNDDIAGQLFDVCVSIWTDTRAASDIRCHAFRLMAKIAKKHVMLIDEVLLLCDSRYTGALSSGIKHSINKIILQIKKNIVFLRRN